MNNRGGAKRKREDIAFRKHAITIDGSTTLDAIEGEHLKSSGITTAILDNQCQATIVARLPECITTVYITEFVHIKVLQAIPETVSIAILKSNCKLTFLAALPKHLQIKTNSGEFITVRPQDEQDELEIDSAVNVLDVLTSLKHSTDSLQALAEEASQQDSEEARPAKKPRLEATPEAAPAQAAPLEVALPTPAVADTIPAPILPFLQNPYSYPRLFNPIMPGLIPIQLPQFLPLQMLPQAPLFPALPPGSLATPYGLFSAPPAPSAPQQFAFMFNLGQQ